MQITKSKKEDMQSRCSILTYSTSIVMTDAKFNGRASAATSLSKRSLPQHHSLHIDVSTHTLRYRAGSLVYQLTQTFWETLSHNSQPTDPPRQPRAFDCKKGNRWLKETTEVIVYDEAAVTRLPGRISSQMTTQAKGHTKEQCKATAPTNRNIKRKNYCAENQMRR